MALPSFPARLLDASVAAVVLAALSGCVVLPVTETGYDPHCRQVTRHMTLQPVQVGALVHCANQGCEALVIAGAVSVAASTIVSGSIAVVGNVAYWVEERGNCRPESAAIPAPASSAPPPGLEGLDPTPAPLPRRVVRPAPAPASAAPATPQPTPYPSL